MKKSLQTIKYGIVGFSRNQFDKTEAKRILNDIFQKIHTEYSDKNVEIISGYTNSGVPKIAYELANQYGFKTVGYSAKQALKVRSGTYPVDQVILKGEKFGDESDDFVRYIDYLIRVGGGSQSRHEVAMFKKIHDDDLNTSQILEEYEVEWYGR